MIDLKKARLPESVTIAGRAWQVQTNFKYWLRFLELTPKDGSAARDFSFMFKGNAPKAGYAVYLALIEFCAPAQVLPRKISASENGARAVDYSIDADYIYAAFMERYGIDLVESDMHWYKFLALFRGLRETKLNDIIGYRLYESPAGKKDAYARRMEELRRAWALPEEKQEDAAFEAFEAHLLKSKNESRADKKKRGAASSPQGAEA